MGPLEQQLLRQTLSDYFEPGSGGCEFAPNIRECNATEIWCDIGYWDTTETCWMGNYCIPEVLEDGCPGFCHVGCNWETEEWCDMGMDSNDCWLGNYCHDLSSGGCPEGTSLDDYYDSLVESDGCPGMCSQICDWDNEEWCDMGVDSNGCWLGNFCQDIASGGCPDLSTKGAMEKKKALANRR